MPRVWLYARLLSVGVMMIGCCVLGRSTRGGVAMDTLAATTREHRQAQIASGSLGSEVMMW